jgi:hypothetical protein
MANAKPRSEAALFRSDVAPAALRFSAAAAEAITTAAPTAEAIATAAAAESATAAAAITTAAAESAAATWPTSAKRRTGTEAAASSAATRPFFGSVDAECAPAQFIAVEPFDRLPRLFIGLELHERESSRAARLPICRKEDVANGSSLGKQILYLIARRMKIQIPYEYLRSHTFLFCARVCRALGQPAMP